MNRAWLIHKLPKNSVGAEIGVWTGDFSLLRLKIVRPQKLVLVDVYATIPTDKAG